MKKKVVFLVAIILTFAFGIYNVSARSCQYDYKGKKIVLTFTKDSSTNSFKTSCTIDGTDCNANNAGGYDRVINFIDGSMITSDEQCYKTLNVCTLKDGFVGLGGKYLGIFGSSLDKVSTDQIYAETFDYHETLKQDFWVASIFMGGTTCSTPEYKGGDIDSANLVSFCDMFVEQYNEIGNAVSAYTSCDSKSGKDKSVCRAKALTDFDEKTDKLKNTCNTIMRNSNLGVNDGCISSCLNANDNINVLRKYLGDVSSDNDCGIDDKVKNWILNIVKWVKYILPVIVIIFGIVDFIKAILADKDDEMKKAQGRFIKRLIAAALVFIVPFILQFILEKMGFEVNSCGLF